MIERLEDAEDRAFMLDYTARRDAGLLTPDEQDFMTLEDATAELERQFTS